MASVDSYFNIDESFAINDHDTVKIMQQSVRDRDSVSFSVCLSLLSRSLSSLSLSLLSFILSRLSLVSLSSLSLSLSRLSLTRLSLSCLSLPLHFTLSLPPNPLLFLSISLLSLACSSSLSLSVKSHTNSLSNIHRHVQAML